MRKYNVNCTTLKIVLLSFDKSGKWNSHCLLRYKVRKMEVVFRSRSSHAEVFCKKGILINFAKFTGKHLWVSFLIKLLDKKETLAQVFSCEFCEISKNTFFNKTPLVVASADHMNQRKIINSFFFKVT